MSPKKINKKNLIFFLLIVSTISFLSFQHKVLAEDTSAAETVTSQCDLLEGESKEKCVLLEEKEAAYKKIIELKQKQQSSLDKQISLMQSEMTSLETEITENQEKISRIDSQLNDLAGRIQEKEKSISKQRKMLAGLIQVYYENTQKDPFTSITKTALASAFLASEDQMGQVSQKVNEMLSNIQALKNELEKEHNAVEENKNKVITLKNQLEDKTDELEDSKKRKTTLLAETQGEEAKYKKKLERVEQQKQDLLGDINELYVSNSAEIEALKATLPTPEVKYRAANSWYYSQKDPRWGDKTIGQSKSLLKDYGCALSSVAMVFTFHGKTVTPATMAKQPIYYWDLISWPTEWNGVSLIKKTGHNYGGIDWDTVDKEIEKNNPVIVFVRAKGRAGHYVVIHNKDKQGRYVVHDPYFGPNIFLDSTVKLLGKIYGTTPSIKSVDQIIVYQ